MKQELFQVDDVYEQYYFVPENQEDAELQMELFTDRKKNALFLSFLENMLDEVERNEFPICAGIKNGNPVYFVYELELRKLQMTKQDAERHGRGIVVCFGYQRRVLQEYYGKEVEIMVLDCGKVKQYLCSIKE